MSVNVGLAQLSDHFLLATVVFYTLAMLAFAGEFAYGRRAGAGQAEGAAGADAAAGRAAEPAAAKVPAGLAVTAARSGAPSAGTASPAGTGTGSPGTAPPGGGRQGRDGLATLARPGRWRAADGPVGAWVRIGMVLSVTGLACHILGVLLRGMSEHRIPWGNMYEFVTAITCAAMAAFLVLAVRYRAYFLGLFVLAPVVLALGLCATVLYTAPGPLMPALHSYWIAIHVTAAIISSGSFIVAAVVTVMYLAADRYTRRRAAGRTSSRDGIIRWLPSPDVLDRLSYRTVVFAFPVWTFTIIAGAIWADQAWGRYWGWDPKETWSFITWVVYAGFLHARATAGWRGRKAAIIQLAGFACLMFNLIGVNLWITGLHSYAGIS